MNNFSQEYWTRIYAANLILPLLICTPYVRGTAGNGVFLAVTAYWLAGNYACRKKLWIMKPLMIGCRLVALTQLFPILQVSAGILALNVVSGYPPVLASTRNLPDVRSGFMGAAINGGILLFVATLVGLPFAWAQRRRPIGGEVRSAGELSMFDAEIDGQP